MLYKGSKFIYNYLDNIIEFKKKFLQYEPIIKDEYSPVNKFLLINPYLSQFTNIIYCRLSIEPRLYVCWNNAVKICKAKYLNNANVEDAKNIDSIFLISLTKYFVYNIIKKY